MPRRTLAAAQRPDAHVPDELRGMVVLSGYRCPLYDELFADWRRVDVSTHADGSKDRTESLWLSSRCPQSGLFDTHDLAAVKRMDSLGRDRVELSDARARAFGEAA